MCQDSLKKMLSFCSRLIQYLWLGRGISALNTCLLKIPALRICLYMELSHSSSMLTCLLPSFQYNYQNPWNYGQYYPPPPT